MTRGSMLAVHPSVQQRRIARPLHTNVPNSQLQFFSWLRACRPPDCTGSKSCYGRPHTVDNVEGRQVSNKQ
ncbi:unnamed protein product [Nezara viridula]|uniref:Uncharacterized protein n=1 Tax=Nezara viridula TaxID=85310 RepID=A0A9P0H1V4_NEZVI|nr:unnamed protein product [Nezara viridula]